MARWLYSFCLDPAASTCARAYRYLIWVFYKEWQKETRACGTPWNPILTTPVFQTALTGLNYFWTVSLFTKPKKYKQL
jgi:hypothetical protein